MVGARATTLLHIFPSFARGGQQMRLAAIGAALGDRFRHHIVSLDGDLSASSILPAASAEPLALRKTPGVSLANLRRLGERFRTVAPDLLCTYNFGAMEAALANVLGPRMPHIHYEDGFGADESGERQKLQRVLMRRLVLRQSFVALPSRSLESIALRRWKLPPAKVRRIANGIDLARFSRSAERRKSDAVAIGSVGALRPEKNFAALVRIFRNMSAPASVTLTIVGDGPERRTLASMAAGDGRIKMAGATTTPELYYRGFDIFALSSVTEQMPLSLMEAMAAGLPVVATDVGDVREMLAPENREFAVRPGDDTIFAAALGRLIEDEGLRRRLGDANAAKAHREFSLEAMVRAHEALYYEALERRRP